MMKVNIIAGIIIAITGWSVSNAQTFCKVLKPEISTRYNGQCKEGLAHGTGEATGEDFYRGEFIKGLPDGEGTYIWKNGATYTGEWKRGLRDGNGTYIFKGSEGDSILSGKWKSDRFMGNPAMLPYVVEYRNSIGRVSITKVGDRPYVKYRFLRNGTEATGLVSNILMQGNSGSEIINPSFIGYEQVKFPFKGKLTFNAPNDFMAATLYCELRITINQSGAWLVTIFF